MHGRGTALNPPELMDFVLVLFSKRKLDVAVCAGKNRMWNRSRRSRFPATAKDADRPRADVELTELGGGSPLSREPRAKPP